MELFTLPDYEIVDGHMHPYLASDRSFPFDIADDYDTFFAEQRRAGIGLSCGSFNIYNDGSDFTIIEECNRRVLELYRARPHEFMPGVNVHPFFPEKSCRAMEEFHRMGLNMVGELAWYVMGYPNYSVPGMSAIFETARDLDMLVSLHPSSNEDISNVAKNFPTLKIMVAHPAAMDGITANYEMAQKYRNIRIDLSGGGLFRWGMLRKGVDMIGADRIVFGTDYPVCNAGMNAAGVLFEHLSQEELQKILRTNMLELIGRL